ncbi:hypothetical protein [Streptomyces sp. OUCMDZ-3434]|uniref:hypothetical protein n=1 Tax=Streptomyces sp. OUCMDZ-3434 TaxID=1535304 RepID=UPI001E4FCBC9|nr:hypothetical protein [Streptomyces sp. OUCMDZ-3434]
MAIAELVLKYLDTLVWPVVTLVLVWMLRAQVRQAFGRLTRWETPAGTLEFEAEARAVRDEADDLRASAEGPAQGGLWPGGLDDEPPPDEEDGPPDPAEEPEPDVGSRGGGWGGRPGGRDVAKPSVVPAPRSWPDFRYAMDLTEHGPVAAVCVAWLCLLDCVAELQRAHGAGQGADSLSPRSPLIETWLWVVDLGLSPEAHQLFARLQTLWREALRDPHLVTSAAARDYVRSCHALAAELRKLL